MGNMSELPTAVIARKEVPSSVFLPYGSQITNRIVRLVDGGGYLAVIRIQGAAHESADPVHINGWHNQLNQFMRNIASPHVSLWTHIVRREYQEYPGGEFQPGFAADFNAKYREAMAGNTMLVNELYVSLIYRPTPLKAARLLESIAQLFGGKKAKADLLAAQTDDIEMLDKLIVAAESALERYEPEVLGVYEHNGNRFSEIGEFLAFLVNSEWRRFPLPRAKLQDVLTGTRSVFGAGGLLAFKTPTALKYGAVLSIKEYPTPTNPGMLNQLLSMPFEFVLGQSFTFLSKPVAMGQMNRQHARLVNAGDVARSQVDEIADALDDLASNRFVMGAHYLALVIHAKDKKELNYNLEDAIQAFGDGGIIPLKEDLANAGGFYSVLPGNFKYRVQVSPITSLNFAAFSSFHNYPIGRIRGSQWGDAVAMFDTTSGSPFYFNFHKSDPDKTAKLDPNHKELANTVIIGKSGTGKTVLEMTLLTMMQKFRTDTKPMTAVIFDKDLGASIAVRAMGGKYFPIKNGVPSGMNPLQMEATPNNLSFVERLLRQLVSREGMPLRPSEEKTLNDAIVGVMGDPSRGHKGMPHALRRLNSVLEFLDASDEDGLHGRLAPWCKGGRNAWLFDNPIDKFDIDKAPIIGFDVTEFLENPETRTPTVMYLFHRVENLFDGRRVPIFMEEFPKLLNDPAFEDLAKNKLVTIRKQDGFLVLIAQTPEQIQESPIAATIVSQTATKIFLPNPEADHQAYVDFMKLTEREFQIVKSLGEKSRKFLIKQGDNSVVGELNLRGFDDELAVLSGNTGTSLLVERLVAEHGEDPKHWYEIFQQMRNGMNVTNKIS